MEDPLIRFMRQLEGDDKESHKQKAEIVIDYDPKTSLGHLF